MNRLEVPGKRLRQYSGTGTLVRPDTARFEGGFELIQLADGRLVGKFYFRDEAPDTPVSDPDGRFVLYALHGVTIQGWDVSSDSLYIVKRTYDSEGPSIEFHAAKCDVTHIDLSATSGTSKAYQAVFGLVNLRFHGDRIDLDVNGYKIAIIKVDQHNSVVESLKIHQGIEVTCEALIRLETWEVTDRLLRTVQDTCVLLSFASGTRINWLYYDVVIPPRLRVKSHLFGDSMTLPFSVLRLVSMSPDRLAQFVSSTFDAYRAKKEEYGLYAVLAMYLVAKIPYLFVGSRISLINQALEALKSSMVDEYMLEASEIEAKIEALIEGTREVWLDSFSELGERDKEPVLAAITGKERVKGLARLSYGRGLKKIVKSLELSSEQEAELLSRIGRLIYVRNILTHDPLSYEKVGLEAHNDFTKFVNLADLILLKVLEYEGEYLDCSDGDAAKTLG